MSVKLECIGCREIKEFPAPDKYPVCDDCMELDKERHQQLQAQSIMEHTCSLCGYSGPAIDNHHIHGRKVSNETIRVCANCHREIHAGTRTV